MVYHATVRIAFLKKRSPVTVAANVAPFPPGGAMGGMGSYPAGGMGGMDASFAAAMGSTPYSQLPNVLMLQSTMAPQPMIASAVAEMGQHTLAEVFAHVQSLSLIDLMNNFSVFSQAVQNLSAVVDTVSSTHSASAAITTSSGQLVIRTWRS